MEWDMEKFRTQMESYDLSIYEYDTIDSTNNECKRKVTEGEKRCLILASQQTEGRGRSGKCFYSPYGGLYMSIALPIPSDVTIITCKAAVIVAQSIERITHYVCDIKWVNDVYYQGKKVCGILTEAVSMGIIVGIGINIAPSDVPQEYQDVVGFLNCPEEKYCLVEEISKRLLEDCFDTQQCMLEYRRRNVVLGKLIRCKIGNRIFYAQALEIDDEGGLVVLGPNGMETLRFGEVEIKGDYI